MINNLPKDFTDRMKEQLGGEYEAFIKSYDMQCIKSLRVNTLKCSVREYRNIVSEDLEEEAESVKWEKSGIYFKESEEGSDGILLDSPGKSPLHAAGAYYIQEASAMLPVTLLSLKSQEGAECRAFEERVDRMGLKVLDLCAAPGGKSTQIASYMNGCGLLVSNEIVPSRAKILSENIECMGVRNALVISEDPVKLAGRFPSFFDRILVDAPCSGEGMFRKHPEAVDEWSLENVQRCADRQDMILDCASKMLAPGGKIVYSTCTFAIEEDEGTVSRFIASHPEFEICDPPQRLFPHKARGEGHFAVSFVRSGSYNAPAAVFSGNNKSTEGKRGKSSNSKVLSAAEWELLCEFTEETFSKDSDFRLAIDREKCGEASRLIRFGDSIYLAPDFMPDTAGLKVLRAGLKIGEFKKNRFEPDHALALASKKEDVKLYADYSSKSNEIKEYLKGMTLNVDYETVKSNVTGGCKGWCLICTDGLSLGWGKIAGEIVKNHYPKGLRVQ